MTKLKGIITVLGIILMTTATFANVITDEAQQKLRTEIAQHLENIDLTKYDTEKISLHITFMVNNENEIVVLSTSDAELDKDIKWRLNYKEVTIDPEARGKIYSIPVTLKT